MIMYKYTLLFENKDIELKRQENFDLNTDIYIKILKFNIINFKIIIFKKLSFKKLNFKIIIFKI